MLSLAVNWEVYRRTHSAAMLGLIGLFGAIPVILFAIPAGHLADRLSRRGIMLVTQFISVCTSLALAAVSWTQADIRLLYALLFVAGTTRAFGWAARSSLLLQLVPTEAFGNAVTWNSSAFESASVTGPALGGFLVKQFGFAPVYMLDAVCQLGFFILLIFIKTRKNADAAPEQQRGKKPAGLDELFSGLRFVWKTKIILATITLDLFAVLFGGATALLPIFADQILHCDATGLGWLRAAPSMGAILMALFLAHRPPLRRAGRAMVMAVAGFGLAWALFGLSRSFWISMPLLILSGACDNVSVVVRHTLVQLLTPNVMRGRVSAVNNVFIGSSNDLGAFESGMTAAWFGPVLSIVGGGLATVLIVSAVAKKWPQVLRLGSFTSIKTPAT